MSSFDGKVAIVTGGTRGIGRATAELLASRGATVYAAGRHEEMFPFERVNFLHMDVSNPGSCDAAVESVLEVEERIDVLVANAGITDDALTQKMGDVAFSNVIDVNLKGVFNVVRAVIPSMYEAGRGSIVTTSSIVGEQGNIGQANYAASKAGVIGMTRSWAKEFARKGAAIRVNSVAPGYIRTDMLTTVPEKLIERFEGQTALRRLGTPEEVANVIAFLVSDEASYVTGAVFDVNGGMRL